MKRVVAILLGVMFSMTGNTEERYGLIGRVKENGKPVIYSFDNYMPEKSIVKAFPTLVVIRWEYNGDANNGMPSKVDQERIYQLDDVLNDMASNGASFRVYGRTGANLREFVHYTDSQESYLGKLNKALATHPRYPIEITFYPDAEWSDYKKLMADFKSSGK